MSCSVQCLSQALHPLLSSSWLDGLQQGSSACPSQDQLGVAANPKTFIQAAPPNFEFDEENISGTKLNLYGS